MLLFNKLELILVLKKPDFNTSNVTIQQIAYSMVLYKGGFQYI